MIYDIPQGTALPSCVSLLQDSVYPFHLTGSRYHKTASPNSDWDFITPWSEDTLAWLELFGFKETDSSKYATSSATVRSLKLGGTEVQVQLVHDMQGNLNLRELLPKWKKHPEFPCAKDLRNEICQSYLLTYKSENKLVRFACNQKFPWLISYTEAVLLDPLEFSTCKILVHFCVFGFAFSLMSQGSF